MKGSYLAGAPDFVVEVAYRSVSYDLHAKRRIYERAAVPEYLVVTVEEPGVWFHQLADGVYPTTTPLTDGVIRSNSLPGLWLDVAAVLRRDLKSADDIVLTGLASPEHQAFVERMPRCSQ